MRLYNRGKKDRVFRGRRTDSPKVDSCRAPVYNDVREERREELAYSPLVEERGKFRRVGERKTRRERATKEKREYLDSRERRGEEIAEEEEEEEEEVGEPRVSAPRRQNGPHTSFRGSQFQISSTFFEYQNKKIHEF